jgi:Zn-dependent protease
MAIVAIAGPLANVLLAIASAALPRIVWVLPRVIVPWLVQALFLSILLNLIPPIFHIFPSLPLDGGCVALRVLPNALARPFARLARFGLMIPLGIIFRLLTLGRSLEIDFNIFRRFVAVHLYG